MSDSSEEDIPLGQRNGLKKKLDTDLAKRKSRSDVKYNYDSDSDDQLPLKKRVKPVNGKPAAKSKADGSSKKVVKDEKPVKNGSERSKTVKPKIEKDNNVKTVKDLKLDVKIKEDQDADEKKPVAKRKSKGKSSQSKSNSVNDKENKDGADDQEEEEEEEEESYRWWEDNQNDGSVKWNTLVHQGVLFPPPYIPLPNHVKLKYDDVSVHLPPEAEEVAGFFGAMLDSEHARNPTFVKNFFADFQSVLQESGYTGRAIEKFESCDFKDIYEHYDRLRQEKKALSAAEKKAIKLEKDLLEEKFKVCYLNGRKELVGNFRIEPPGLFRGRGAHPKTGKLKARVLPEQVTINIGRDAPVPEPPVGHKWAEVKHDNTVAWLATWKENINGSTKYVLFAATSSLKGMSDFKKFEKARELKNHIDRIRKDYYKELKDEKMINRQRATAMYLIDVLALRAGGEKGEDEADTVGCCSLRYEHVTFKPPNIVVFDFLGKDSIRFYQEVKVDQQVFKNLKLFKKSPKKVGDDIFDRLDPPTLNRHLQNYMPGLTAKVFRTFNASKTMQDQLAKIANKGTVNEKYVAYNAANRAVAILCNHQRTVSKSHEQSVGKIEDKILEIKLQRYRLKQSIAQLIPSRVTQDADFFKVDRELTDETIARLHDLIIEREIEKIKRKFQRENEKKISEDEKPLPESDLTERLNVISDLQKKLNQEQSGEVDVKPGLTVEKLESQIEKLNERITNTELQLKDKEDNSTVALTTSKINYIDPRLSVMFAKKFEVPIEKLFSKTLRDKFKWAIESADANWRF
ncbi:hypothetical protein V1514DRAFT_330235 [Lipomyces japonicus]|uniref:uncharacterized protein n=1 Tax=Lipomyces japonicus TaxID=56871 RepID=UPI0034CED459